MDQPTPAYYELKYIPVEDPESEGLWLKTSTPLICNLCETVIYSTGGPGYGVLCEDCGRKIINRGRFGRQIPAQPSPDLPEPTMFPTPEP